MNINEELAQKTKFVFRGTVRQAKASNVAEVENTDQTAIVRVDEVIKAPDILSNFAGQEITVKLADKEKVKKGESSVFYTNGWLFGETIAVESLGHTDIVTELAAAAASETDPVKSHTEDIIKDRLKTADAVVTGRVVSVRLPKETLKSSFLTASMSGEEEANYTPVSEHDPKWREAVVEVEDVDKGDQEKKQVVVKFPSSNDVRWYKAHKFSAGEEGVFILHKTEPSTEKSLSNRSVTATLTNEEADTAEEAFTALHPEDFQPIQKIPEIKTLIENVE